MRKEALLFDKDELEKLCEKNNLKLLVLHGSHAQGETTKESDIDIGILAQKKVDFEAHKNILNDFGGFFGDKFDAAFLNNAEPMICYQVATKGKPLFEANKGDFTNFKIQAIGRYMDTKKFRELEKQYIKRAVGRN